MQTSLWRRWSIRLFVVGISCLASEIALPSSQKEAVEYNFNTPVRLLLGMALKTLTVGVSSGRLEYRESSQRPWLTRKSPLKIKSSNGSLSIDTKAKNLTRLSIRSPSGLLTINGKKIFGSLSLRSRKGKIEIINVVDLENYLVVTVGKEMPATWEKEALKAQAIVSRSYALHRLKNPQSRDFHLHASTQDQVYGDFSSIHARVREAVRSTRGKYLATKGKPLKAYFHSRCGGETETDGSVWGSSKSLTKKVICPYCQRYPFTWETTVSSRELKNIFGASKSLREPFILRPPSDSAKRIVSLQGGNPAKNLRTLSANSFRKKLGFERIKSTRFHWDHRNGLFIFRGVGFGHGVGLCQWGARFFAQNGRSYREILEYYYPFANLVVPTCRTCT